MVCRLNAKICKNLFVDSRGLGSSIDQSVSCNGCGNLKGVRLYCSKGDGKPDCDLENRTRFGKSVTLVLIVMKKVKYGHQLEKNGPNIFVNVPPLKQIVVIDRNTKEMKR